MKSFLDWSAYRNAGTGDAYADIPKSGGDYAKAVAVCIGSRQCERPGKGVMCPSFRVSNNPTLTPGGRVKLLKAALNGDFASRALDPALAEAMDWCVGCKGCRRECENEVDMATIKAEYLAQKFRLQGLPLRNRLFGHLPRLLAMPGLRTLLRWRNAMRWSAWLMQRGFGIAARTALPVPVAEPFQEPTESPSATGSDRPEVVLFVDTFSRHFTPNALDAAQTVLAAAGYAVHFAVPASQSGRALCCGRSYFSNGMMEHARREAQRTLQALLPHLQAGRWVVGLEPSCILSLRDEYKMLGLGEAAVQLAEKSLLLEEFIAKELAAKRWALPLRALPELGEVLMHGHCHQKAVGAVKSLRKVLKLIPDLQFEFIEASCCGMAGNFGFEAEHHAASQQMAELALFPALRAAPDAAVVTNGFSCRQQIVNGGFAKPLHIAEILALAMVPTRELA